jgi:hypothetical protein
MDLFERLEQEMQEEKTERVQEASNQVAAQILVWAFVLCAVVLMVAGTARLLMVWF